MISLLFATSAHALSCIGGVYDDNLDGVDIAPPNLEFVFAHTYWSEEDSDRPFELQGPSGVVDYDFEVQEDWGKLVPLEPLAAGTYTLYSTRSDISLTRQFVVEGAIDDEPPAAPNAVQAKRKKKVSVWGREAGIGVSIDGDLERGEHFEVEAIAPGADSGHVIRAHDTSAYVGRGLCLTNYAGYDSGTRYDVRVRTVDLAGNASEWVEVRSTGGCSTAPGSAGLLLTLFAPLALFGRRRSANA